jgi:histidine triad (HIT) family protein
MSECIFCKIIARTIPAALIYEDEMVVAFDDINPQAPTHTLVIPRKHVASIAELQDSDVDYSGV